MSAPKPTDNWCRRKERRLHRRGSIGPWGYCLISTKSRSHPFNFWSLRDIKTGPVLTRAATDRGHDGQVGENPHREG